MALDPFLLSDLDALRAARDPRLYVGGAAPSPVAPGATPGGPSFAHPGGSTDFVGKDFVKRGPNLAAGARPAVPGVASASNFADFMLKGRTAGSIASQLAKGAGKAAVAVPVAAAGVVGATTRDPELTSLVAGSPLEFIGRGLAQQYARYAPEFLGGLSKSTLEADRKSVV